MKKLGLALFSFLLVASYGRSEQREQRWIPMGDRFFLFEGGCFIRFREAEGEVSTIAYFYDWSLPSDDTRDDPLEQEVRITRNATSYTISEEIFRFGKEVLVLSDKEKAGMPNIFRDRCGPQSGMGMFRVPAGLKLHGRELSNDARALIEGAVNRLLMERSSASVESEP